MFFKPWKDFKPSKFIRAIAKTNRYQEYLDTIVTELSGAVSVTQCFCGDNLRSGKRCGDR